MSEILCARCRRAEHPAEPPVMQPLSMVAHQDFGTPAEAINAEGRAAVLHSQTVGEPDLRAPPDLEHERTLDHREVNCEVTSAEIERLYRLLNLMTQVVGEMSLWLLEVGHQKAMEREP